MKKLLALFALLTFSCAAQAGYINEDSSWKQIKRSGDFLASFPSINAAGLMVTVDSFCLDGDMLKTGRTYKKCVEWRDRGDNQECVKKIKKAIQTPATYKYRKCVEWRDRGDNQECVEWSSGVARHKMTYKVDVYELLDRGERDREYAFTKSYTIPMCN